MLGGTLTLYFFVLFAALIVVGSESFGTVEVIAIGMVGFLWLVVARSWKDMVATVDAGDAADAAEAVEDAVAVPPRIRNYLELNEVPWSQQHHARADTAQELAHAIHLTGHNVAKPVVVRADGRPWMVVVPASEVIDFSALRGILHASSVEMVDEWELAQMFPDCELGAEPPFGRLYHVPTLMEQDLAAAEQIAFHGGLHDESIEISTADYQRLERPLVAHFARLPN